MPARQHSMGDIPRRLVPAARSHSTSSTGSTGSSICSSNPSSNPNSPLSKNGHYRIIVMGPAGVGKTCIISQFLYETFHSEYRATIEELHRGEYEVNGIPLTLDILDTSGEYEFPAMRQLSISTGDAFVLVYSVDDEASFEEVKRLREQILDQKNDEFVPIVVVGNKTDCAEKCRVVARETAETTANIDWDNGFVEASAKNNVNVVAIFQELLNQANVDYALSPAVRRRRQSSPVVTAHKNKDGKQVWKSSKRNSCSIS